MLLACMAGPSNTGQQTVTHFFLHLLPDIIFNLARITIPREQASLHTLVATDKKTTARCLQGRAHSVHRKRVKRHKKPVRINQESNKTTSKARMYLLPFLFTHFKVDCHIELGLLHFWHPYSWNLQLLALQGATTQPGQPPPVCSDSDLIPIRIHKHASQCMANVPHLFKDLCLASNRGQVDGIGKGLEIQGEGTFKFSIEDDNGRAHTIKIPNSLCLPELRQCLLLPQHWVQEAEVGQTWMGNFAHECVLNWKGGRKTVPLNVTTNTPMFFTAPSSCAYCAFTLIFDGI